MRKEIIFMNLLCLLLALGALAVAAWAVISGEAARQGIDGLFLVGLCAFMALAFALMPLRAVRQGALRELLKRRGSKPVEAKPPQVAPMAAQEPQEKS